MVGFWKRELAGVLFSDCFFGEPPGLTRLAVTKISKFRFWALSPFERNRRPRSGISPKKGTLSLTFFTSSRVNPPITRVDPSQIVTLVEMSRTEKIGWKNPGGTVTDVEPEIATLGPPYSTNPSNSVTFGFRSRLIE